MDCPRHKIQDPLGFARLHSFELQHNALPLSDGLHRITGLLELLTAQHRDLRQPDPKWCLHGPLEQRCLCSAPWASLCPGVGG